MQQAAGLRGFTPSCGVTEMMRTRKPVYPRKVESGVNNKESAKQKRRVRRKKRVRQLW